MFIVFVFRTIDSNNFRPIIHIAPIPRNESKTVHLVGITQAGKGKKGCLPDESLHVFLRGSVACSLVHFVNNPIIVCVIIDYGT